MDLKDIFIGGGTGLVIILSFIKIPKIEVNFWGWLFKKIGKLVNEEMITKISAVESDLDTLKDDLDSYREEAKLDHIQTIRYRILRFNDETLHNQLHTEEHFNEILVYIDEYEDYCLTHPSYPNTKAELAITNIKKVYEKCLKDKSFL